MRLLAAFILGAIAGALAAVAGMALAVSIEMAREPRRLPNVEWDGW